MTAPGGRASWRAFAGLAGLSLAMSLVVALVSFRSLWFIDEEIYYAHGVRVLQNGRIGWQVDSWTPPLPLYVHGSLLLLHPWTPDLRGPVVQDPDLPGGPETVEGRKNPVVHDSSAWQVRTAVEAAGHRFDRHAFWARLPLAVTGVAWLAVAWILLSRLGADPRPGTAALALSHVFVIEQVRILSDAMVAGCVLLSIWRAAELARRPTLANGAWLGVAFGLGLGSKLSILPVIPAVLLALLPLRVHAVSAAGRAWDAIRELKPLVAPTLAVAPCAAVALWALYGFQVGTLQDAHRTMRPLAREQPAVLQAHPALARATIPMPSFVIGFAVARDVAGSPHVRIDGERQATAARKARHYAARLMAHVGWAMLPLALLAAGASFRDPRRRWAAAAFLLVAAAYLAAMWLQSLEMFSRRAIVLTEIAALLAGLAFHPASGRVERVVRAPLLALHVLVSFVQWGLFASVRDATHAIPLDRLTGLP